jgi:cleavage and polyadenylation specificity factor subunit 1
MQCYTELTAPTAVSQAVALPFLSSKSTNLVVAKTSLIQIFELKTIVTEVDTADKDDVETSPQDIAADTLDRTFFTSDIALQRLENTSKLALVGECQVSGTITSLARIKLSNSKSGGEGLLIAFRDAKASLMEWDPERYAISTVSIHFYESGLPQYPWVSDLSQCANYLLVDPSSRCAALRCGARHLAIIPFRHAGDDLVEEDDDFDPDLDDPADRPKTEKSAINGELDASQTPYAASFILPLTALDPDLAFPVHLGFLHEYRQPTLGILSSQKATGPALVTERRDMINYTLFTLDIEQRASTTILSVTNLPSDINRVLPLPLPLGGALLIGNNELVHIDQSGKTTATAVNEFAKESSSFPMTDSSSVALRLEDCAIEPLGDSGDLLIVLTSGELAVLTFNLDGRTLSGLSIRKIPTSQGGRSVPTSVSCSANLGRGRLFFGSEDNDAVVLGWSRKSTQLNRKRSHAEMLGIDDESTDDEDLDDDEDDLYGGDDTSPSKPSAQEQTDSSSTGGLSFRIHDRLPNFAPCGDLTFGNASSDKSAPWSLSDLGDEADIVYPNGRGTSGGLASVRRQIDPAVYQKIEVPNARAAWAFHANAAPLKGLVPNQEQEVDSTAAIEASYDDYVILSQTSAHSEGMTSLYSITGGGMDQVQEGDFETEGLTLNVGTVAHGTRVVQVRTNEIRCYNAGKSDIYPGSRHCSLLAVFCFRPPEKSTVRQRMTVAFCVFGFSLPIGNHCTICLYLIECNLFHHALHSFWHLPSSKTYHDRTWLIDLGRFWTRADTAHDRRSHRCRTKDRQLVFHRSLRACRSRRR